MGGGIRRSHTYARVYLVANLVLGTHFSRRGVQAADAPPVNAWGPRKKSAEIFVGLPWMSGAYPVFERVNVKKNDLSRLRISERRV